MDDIDPEVLEVLREAVKRQRPYADYFGFAIDRSVAEFGVAEELCEALEAAGQPLVTDLKSRGAGNDPPDCEGTGEDGARIGIEVTELVEGDAIKRAKAGYAYDWAEWPREKLIAAVQERLTDKDGKLAKALGGPYGAHVVIIHTDEPLLNIERVRALIGSVRFEPMALVTRAFLLLSYAPDSKSCPYIELQFSSNPE